jgi:hyaluronan synthase
VTDDLSVAVVIACYNEDPGLFRACLDSVTAQTRLPQRAYVIDDGSTSDECLRVARAWARHAPFTVKLLPRRANCGKRHAQAAAFRDFEPDVWMTMDSDSTLAPDAIANGIAPFARPDVTAVTGLALGSNWHTNLLTRLVDLECLNSFLVGRAFSSRLGAVVVTCGTIAFYRAHVIRSNLDDYLEERFLGARVTAGDDRRLTQYALLRGRVVFQETAVCSTALPTTLGHLVRQRIRWSASFYRGVWWMTRNMSMTRASWWLMAWQASELVVLPILLLAMLVAFTDGALTGIAIYFIVFTLLSWVRSIRYVALRRNDMRTRDQWISAAMAPLISVLYTFVLTPVRYYSLLKVRESSWRTRQQVEVRLSTQPVLEVPSADEWLTIVRAPAPARRMDDEQVRGPLRARPPVPPPAPATPPPARPTLAELCDETLAALDELERVSA